MSVKLPVLKRFCCCVPLRVGVTIIGYWFVLLKSWQIVYLLRLLTTVNNDHKVVMARIIMFHTVGIIINLVLLVLGVMLLVGVHKKKPKYLRHFFIWSLVMLVADIVVVSVSVLCLHLWVTASYYIFIIIHFYFLLVVRSTYLMMEEKENPGSTRGTSDKNVCWDTMQLTYTA